MPVVTVGSSLAPGLGFDRRFRQWAKLIRSAADIDLNAKGGYALTGPFVKWGEAAPLDEGQFLVLASETGSVAHHSYDYALLQCFGGQASPIADSIILGAVQSASLFTDEQLAKAQNSEPYSFACYALLCLMARMPAADLEVEGRRLGLTEATPARRLLDAIFNRDGEQYCPLCDERIRHAERICRRCLEQTIRELDSLDTATACKAAAKYAIQRITS